MTKSLNTCGVLVACLSALGLSAARAADPARPAGNVMDMSLEELVDLRVTSVSKKNQKLSQAAAAIFVITAEDLRRSGATSIPEALRMVPGMEVARINSGSWAVSARGFNSRFAMSLLVLVDGRTVYTPLFSGVFWDTVDTVLDDIERIEVIRGPGASLWGANAVNGVINIITKSAAGTLGGLVTATAGNLDRGTVSARLGGELDERTRYRAWAKAGEQASSAPLFETWPAKDTWNRYRVGARADRSAGNDTLTLQAEALRSRVGDEAALGSLLPPYVHIEDSPLKNEGAHVRGHWRRQLAADADVSVQVYADHARVEYFGIRELRGTFDLEVQRGQRLGAHDLNWGVGYRHTDSRFTPRQPSAADPFSTVALDPARHRLNLWTAFAQDDFTLVPDRLHVIAGGRLEHNDFTGTEFQPNLRFTWTPDPVNTWWAAVSRAIRSPSIIEADGVVRTNTIAPGTATNPGPLAVQLSLRGNPDIAAEKLLAFDAGYRTRLTATLSLDAAAYRNRYSSLRTTETGTPFFAPAPVPHVTMPIRFANGKSGTVTGAEVALDWRPARQWRVQGTYSFSRSRDSKGEGGLYAGQDSNIDLHQASLRTGVSPRDDVDADLWLRHVSGFNVGGVDIPRYTTLDARLAWRARRDVELSIAGQNLADAKHPEFISDFISTTPTQVRRSVQASVRWTF